MTETAIEARNLGRRSGEHWVLRHMDLRVPAGAVYGLLGPPGAGKTTALRTLGGLVRPHEGEVRVRGLDPQRDRLAVMRTVGCAGGELTPLAGWTVGRTIDFYAWIHDDWDRGRSEVLRRRFALPTDRALRNLSPGQRSRLSLLLALVRRPRVLLLDEPFARLVGIVRHEVARALTELLPAGDTTVLLTASRIEDLGGISDHLALLRDGRVRFAGTRDELCASARRVRLQASRSGVEVPDFPWVRQVAPCGAGWSGLLVGPAAERIERLGAAGFTLESVEPPELSELAEALLAAEPAARA